MIKSYRIDAECTDCAEKMEILARNTQGIRNAKVNFTTMRMDVEFDENQDEQSVMKAVRNRCKELGDGCEVFV